MKFFKNRFLIIMLLSIVTLVVLVVGAMTLYKEEELVFSSDGYIIEAGTKVNKKYYFSANTKYKENIEDKIIFDDVDNNKVAVDPASFVHYSNGDVIFLKKGALVDLTELNSSMINYYNITNQSTIKYEKDRYVVSSNDKKIDIKSFMGRISDNKYLITGEDLKLKIPDKSDLVDGDYFEVLFIEDGIVKIDNEKASYQVTAQDTYIHVGANITINLGNGKIVYEDDVKMLMSQITISGDENIDLDVDDKHSTAGGGGGGGSGSGTGDGDGDGTGEGGDGTLEEGDTSGLGGAGDGTGEGGNGTGEGGDGTGEGGDGTGGSGASGNGEGVETKPSLQIELIEVVTTATTIDLSFQLNNSSLATGKLLYYFTNLSTGKREGNSAYIDLVNGTFKIEQESFSPSTDYSFTIIEVDGNNEKRYFQKTFRTKDLGITLEKLYATYSSLKYSVNFSENTDVTKAVVSICEKVEEDDKIVLDNEDDDNCVYKDAVKDDIGEVEVLFDELKSNTTYAVSINEVEINGGAYSGVYTINRLDTTLKETPSLGNVEVKSDSEAVRFDIKLKKVTDPNNSIIKYTYKIYLAKDIENPDILNPIPVYEVSKNDYDVLVLNLNEIDKLNTGVDYRCIVYAEYNDNEMVREVKSNESNNFLIKSKPKIKFEETSPATMNSVKGTLTLIDANCMVPFNGRSCSSLPNNLFIRYYKVTEDEHANNDRIVDFKKDLTSELEFNDLESNTTYAVKLFGRYFDDKGELSKDELQIGDTFFIKTVKSPNIYFEVIDNISGQDKDGKPNMDNVVTVDARFTAPENPNIINEISTVTFNLYSGRHNKKENLIGTYVITDPDEISSLFNNKTINNSLFTDVTGMNVGKINTLQKLVRVTNKFQKNDSFNHTLNGAYTIEVDAGYDSTGKNHIPVENPVYTFNLTPSYYLDSRIASNPKENYLTVTPITKGGLTDEEYEKLSKKVPELESLKDDTVVGLIIENSLSDIFVDSAYKTEVNPYEKVVVNYSIYNAATNKAVNTIYDATLDEVVDKISLDMGNKYQPKEQIIYLASSGLDDGKAFTRGYKYKIGFTLDFITPDGDNPSYTNDMLYKVVPIERQEPIYVQYINTSDDQGITYRYKFNDIDKAIANNNFYYTLGDSDDYNSVKNALKVDGEYHEVMVPIKNNSKYTLYYSSRNTDNKESYIPISNYNFEKEYKYDSSIGYSIIDDNSNILKIKLEDNVYNNRAYAYKVTIKANGVEDYTRYFLASKLGVLNSDTGLIDSEGEAVIASNKFIGIDYASIIDFMGNKMTVDVFCYYDSGLVGVSNKFSHGTILKNNETGKYLNTYYQGKDYSPTSGEDMNAMGIYHIRDGFSVGNSNMFIYNHLIYDPDTVNYNNIVGIESVGNLNLEYYGIDYGVSYTRDGIVLSNGNNKYTGYNFRVLNGVTFNTDNNSYLFDTIIPSIKVTADNTINSVRLNVEPSGIYGNKQFIKDGKEHNKIYVDFYSDKEMTQKLDTVGGNVNIGSTTTIDRIVYNNLKPATTYYYTISAWINNKYTRLFDTDILNKNKRYDVVDYSSNTLDVSGLLNGIAFSYKPTKYNGEYAENTLSWRLNLKNTENYRIRFELYRPDGTTTTIDPETSEEIVVPNFKEVKFNGSDVDSSSCNKDSYGAASVGYVNGCYINVDKDKVNLINKVEQKYLFTNKDFVYGGNYYKLVVYAVPYTNKKYVEEDRLVLYENNSLSTTGNMSVNGINYNISIPVLEEASFDLGDSLITGIKGKNYYISFIPNVIDNHKVMKYGAYTISIKDEDKKEVNKITNIDRDSTIGKEYTFNDLKPNSLYYIELSYNSYRNNVGFSAEDKISSIPFTTIVYTPVNNNITLGSINAKSISGKSISLTYNGSSNLVDKIVKVKYTITADKGNSKVSGEFVKGENTSSIFTVASDKIPRLIIDVSNVNHSDNIGFNFIAGYTYIITTNYYYYEVDSNGDFVLDGNGNKIEKRLEDLDGKFTYTTIFNA